jgi:sister chromatid cohesion protein DCC1
MALPGSNKVNSVVSYYLPENVDGVHLFLFHRDLCGEKQTIGALLTKYSRSSMQNGIKVYNSRRLIS